MSLVYRDGRASVSDLTERFGLSQVTIRSDLAALAAQGRLIRVHGGARALRRADGLPELFGVQQSRHTEQKQRIGAAAAAMVQDGNAIVLDSSTTALSIVPYLKGLQRLTVATYSLAVANALLDAPSVNVLVLGGFLNRATHSLWGDDLGFLKSFNFQIGFFGAKGLTLEHGLTDAYPDEAKIKKQLAACAGRVCAVIDSRKWFRTNFVPFLPLERLDCVITDDGAPPDMVAAVRNAGIQVVVV